MARGDLLAPRIVAGTGPNRFVNGTTGNDSWDGTSATFVSGSVGPWKTLGKLLIDAAANPTSGRTYIIADGVYADCIRKTIAALATGNGPITIKAANRGGVVWQPLKTKTNGSHSLPTGTIFVESVAPGPNGEAFAASGAITLWDQDGKGQVVSYTGVATDAPGGGPRFTGCTGGTGTIPASRDVAPRVAAGSSLQNLQLQNCSYVRVWGIVFEGLYQRPSTDNNAIVYLAGTSHHCLFEACELRHGYDHGIFSDTTTDSCQVRNTWAHDGGSPCAYPVTSSKVAAGTALTAATYRYKVWGRYECGSMGTDDGTGGDLETSITVVNGDRVTVSFPAVDSLHPDRSVGVRVFRATTSISNGTTCNYYDLPAGTTQFVDNGQAPDGTVVYSTSFSNTDHAVYLLGTNHSVENVKIHDWDFGHVVQLYQKCSGTVFTCCTITHEAYSNGVTGRHAAGIILGSDTGVLGETVENCLVVNSIFAHVNQGVFGYAALGQVKSLNQVGGITLPGDGVTTFNMPINNVTSLPAFGQCVLGRTDRTAMATIYYDSISGSTLQNCRVIDGFGLTFANSEQIRFQPVSIRSVNANITLPGDTSTTFTLTLASTSGMASGGGYIGLGHSGQGDNSFIKYAGISGANLTGCTVIHGTGQSYVIGDEARYYTLSGHGNAAHHNLVWNPTFTHERNDPRCPGSPGGAASALLPIVDYVSNGGNIKGQDPKFVSDTARDYRLQADSPARGAAVQGYVPIDDFDGNTRTSDDLGCYGYFAAGGGGGADSPEETDDGSDLSQMIAAGVV